MSVEWFAQLQMVGVLLRAGKGSIDSEVVWVSSSQESCKEVTSPCKVIEILQLQIQSLRRTQHQWRFRANPVSLTVVVISDEASAIKRFIILSSG